jgi:RHS repeat-associated protein
MNHQATHNQPTNIAALRRGVQRYGFNGKEKDDENSEGAYDFGERTQLGALGRFVSMDRLSSNYAGLSTYQFAANRPIQCYDYQGNEIIVTSNTNNETGKTHISIIITGKIIIDDNLKMSESQKQRYMNNLNSKLSEVYSKAFDNVEVVMDSKLELGSEADLKPEDHAIYVGNLHVGAGTSGVPDHVGGFVSSIGGKKAFFPKSPDLSTAAHEVGHWLGLFHPKDIASEISKTPFFVGGNAVRFDYKEVFEMFSSDNIMHHSEDTHLSGGGNNFDLIQVDMIVNADKLKVLNQGTNQKIGTVSDEYKAAAKNSYSRQMGSVINLFDKIAKKTK